MKNPFNQINSLMNLTVYRFIKVFVFFIVFTPCYQLTAQTTSDDFNNFGLNELEHLKPKKALKYFNKAIELDSINETAYYNRALTYFELGEFKKAIEDYQKLIKFKTLDNQIYFELGQCYNALGEYETAILNFNKSIEMNPKSPSSYIERAMLKIKLNDQKGACEDLNIANNLEYNIEVSSKLVEFCK